MYESDMRKHLKNPRFDILVFFKCPHFLEQKCARNAVILIKVGQILWQINQFLGKSGLAENVHPFLSAS